MHCSPSLHALLTVGGSTAGLLLIVAIKDWVPVRRKRHQDLWLLLLTSGLYAAAIALQFWALGVAPVGVIESVKRGVGMAMALISGILFFEERILLQQVFWVLLMSIGMVLLL